jgi:selenocysteine lyase/cysteine desulfurase
VKPDFVSLSFYKMFGYPTGVGALILRREMLGKLHRPWFGGGTVRFVSAQNQVHRLHLTGEAFEDGTLNFLNIPAISAGLDFLDGVGMDHINRHVARLTERLIKGLLDLRHSNGNPLVDFYGPPNMDRRGGTVTFNVLTPDGQAEVEAKLIEQRANERHISLRTGCFCNPGAAETAFHYSAVEAYQCFDTITAQEFTLQQFSACMNDMPVGAVRVSLGIASNEADVDSLLDFLRTFVDVQPEPGHQWRVPELADGGA